jgi:hypothetical protein
MVPVFRGVFLKLRFWSKTNLNGLATHQLWLANELKKGVVLKLLRS